MAAHTLDPEFKRLLSSFGIDSEAYVNSYPNIGGYTCDCGIKDLNDAWLDLYNDGPCDEPFNRVISFNLRGTR